MKSRWCWRTGDAIETDNVVIQQVKTSESDIVDVVGYPHPRWKSPRAWLLRDGKLVIGTWKRGLEGDTVFHTKKGDEFQLKPGTTFVELAPTGMFTAPVSSGPSAIALASELRGGLRYTRRQTIPFVGGEACAARPAPSP